MKDVFLLVAGHKLVTQVPVSGEMMRKIDVQKKTLRQAVAATH